MAYKVFIDGQAGTTGLRLAKRLAERADIRLLEIPAAKRRDIDTRLTFIADADISILCLPDDGALEIMAAVDGTAGSGGPDSPFSNSRIIDCSTAHRTAEGWVFGMPEIIDYRGSNSDGRPRINSAVRVANPGCHATGFIMAVRPLTDAGILCADAQLSCYSLTGYSGGGKAMIAEYEAADRRKGDALSAPRRYALGQAHKHIPEMQKYTGLCAAPFFAPVVCDFYSGMVVGTQLPRGAMRKPASAEEIHGMLAAYYADCPFVKVRDMAEQPDGGSIITGAGYDGGGFLSAEAFAGRDDIEIFVAGKDDRIEIVSRYDNLGKGASGAAIQNMNLMLGLPEATGLELGK